MCSAQPAITEDSLFQGRLVCRQHADGYRFSVDAVLAAHFCHPGSGATVLDLGAGCGVIGLILAHRHAHVRVTGIELQPGLAALAAENIRRNAMQDRVRIVEGDARQIGRVLAPESFDLVVCNPPYRGLGSGRASSAGEAAIARHELRATLADMVGAAAFCVRNRGGVVFVYPAARMATLLYRLQE
ncbi:MAG TPA: methyltransferase domain-containing protein, partial [Desulfobulbus sp.]|nr:methyltransferase domain-containing protein [Desulfobulbus sp.]